MKKILLFKTLLVSCLAVVAVACAPKYDDTPLKDAINSLEARVKAMEIVVKAFEANLFITNVAEVADGYEITFSDGSKAAVSHGNKGAEGTPGTPGANGRTLIESVVVGTDEITFTLTDGSSFSIPIGEAPAPLSIAFDVDDVSLLPEYQTVYIGYTVTSPAEKVDVYVSSPYNFDMLVTPNPDDPSGKTGEIEVYSYLTDEYAHLVVFVSDGEKMIMRRLSFEAPTIEISDNASKSVPAAGGNVTLEFLSNTEYEVSIPAAATWLSVAPTTRAMESHTVTLVAEANEGYARSAKVTVWSPLYGVGVIYTITQTASGETPEGVIKEGTYSITYTSPFDETETPVSFNMDVVRYDETYYKLSGNWLGEAALSNPVLLGTVDAEAKKLIFDGTWIDPDTGEVDTENCFDNIIFAQTTNGYYITFATADDDGDYYYNEPLVLPFDADGYLTAISYFDFSVYDSSWSYLGAYEVVENGVMSYVGSTSTAAAASAAPMKSDVQAVAPVKGMVKAQLKR